MSTNLENQTDEIKKFIQNFDEYSLTKKNLENFPHLHKMINYLENKKDKNEIEHLILMKYYFMHNLKGKFLENCEYLIKMGNEIAFGMKKVYQHDLDKDKKYTDSEISEIKNEFNDIKDKIKSDFTKNDLSYFYAGIGLIEESLEMNLKIKDKSKCSNYHWNLYLSYTDLEMKEMALYQLVESMKFDYLPKNSSEDINECVDCLSDLIKDNNNLVKLLNVGPDRLTISRVSTTLSFMMNNYAIEIIVEYM